MKHLLLFAAFCMVCLSTVRAQADSIVRSGNRLQRYWNSLVHGNVDRTFEKPVDLSFVVAPCYTREGSFGVGGAATGLYRLDRRDSIMQPSDFSLSGSATVKGFYGVTLNGNNHFRGNRSRLSYRIQFQNKNLDFWGISREACEVNPVAAYRRQMIRLEADYVYKLTPAFHLGAALRLNYTRASDLTHPAYLEGQKPSYFFAGAGLSLHYDTRDFILNPHRGVCLLLREVVYPACLSDHGRTLFATTFVCDAYIPAWNGATLAFDFYGQFFGDDAPWPLREELGSGGSRMRGYYAGRYVDNNQLTVQLELRQHVYGRVGCVAWVGGGTVFSRLGSLRLGDVLPNYGLGLRIEFKHRVNVRVDYGFGKDTGGFVFQFAEAF